MQSFGTSSPSSHWKDVSQSTSSKTVRWVVPQDVMRVQSADQDTGSVSDGELYTCVHRRGQGVLSAGHSREKGGRTYTRP